MIFRVVFFVLLFTSLKVRAFDIELVPESVDYRLGDSCLVLHDGSGKLSFSEVLEKEGLFKPLNASLAEAASSCVWYKISVRNKTDNPHWFLEVENPSIHEVDLYYKTGEKVVSSNQSASEEDALHRVESNFVIFPLILQPGDKMDYYLHLKHPGINYLPIRIATIQTLYETHHPWDFAESIYFGFLIALMIYNLFVFAHFRDNTYIYYVFCTFFIGLQILCFKGYGFQYLWSDYSWLNNSNIYCALNIIFFGFFTNSFLHAERYVPELKFLQWSLIPVVIFVLLVWSPLFKLIMLIPYMLYISVMGGVAYYRGFMPAKFYLSGYGLLIVAIIILVADEYHFIESNNFSSNALQIGSALESLVLSYALADKINFYKKEKEQTQAKALKEATSFSSQLIQSQENERKRIASEMQESLGQSLILVKNKLLMLSKDPGSAENRHERLVTLTADIADTIDVVRTLSYSLRPFHIDMIGLTQSLKDLVDKVSMGSRINFEVEIDQVDNIFSRESEVSIYRIIQEYLKSVINYEDIYTVRLKIKKEKHQFAIKLEHHGEDLSGWHFPYEGDLNNNLLGLKERILILNGKFSVEKIKQGSVLTFIQIPIQRQDN